MKHHRHGAFLTLLCASVIATPLDAKSESAFWLGAGPGPEDIVVTEWKKPGSDQTRPIAVTSVARRSPVGFSSPRGFQFITLENNYPVLCNEQPKVPQGVESAGPWQGLSWQPRCALADGGGILAASRAEARLGWRGSEKIGIVDLFTWDKSSAEPRLVHLTSTPALGITTGRKFSKCFNSITLARDGSIYATVMSLGFSEGPPPCVFKLEDPKDSGLVKGSIYYWRPGWADWKLAAKNIKGANGIVLSPDERSLHVSSALTARLFTFSPQKDGSLHGPVACYKLPGSSSPDNLKLCSGGFIAAAYTSSKWKIGGHMLLKTLFSKSLGMGPRGYVHVWKPGIPTSHHSYALPKPPLAVSTAVPFGSWWLVGQIYDEGVLCVPAGASVNR